MALRFSVEQVRLKLESDDLLVEQAIVYVWRCQTSDEQSARQTRHQNGEGFRSGDAKFGSYLAMWILSGKNLTDNFLTKGRKIAIRYARQVSEGWEEVRADNWDRDTRPEKEKIRNPRKPRQPREERRESGPTPEEQEPRQNTGYSSGPKVDPVDQEETDRRKAWDQEMAILRTAEMNRRSTWDFNREAARKVEREQKAREEYYRQEEARKSREYSRSAPGFTSVYPMPDACPCCLTIGVQQNGVSYAVCFRRNSAIRRDGTTEQTLDLAYSIIARRRASEWALTFEAIYSLRKDDLDRLLALYRRWKDQRETPEGDVAKEAGKRLKAKILESMAA